MNEFDEMLDYLNNMKFNIEMTKIIASANQIRSYMLNNDFTTAVDFANKVNQETDYEGTSILIPVNQIKPIEFCNATLDALLRLTFKKIYDKNLDKYIQSNIRINFGDHAGTNFKIYTLLK